MAAELTGDPTLIAELVAAEARLGVTFCDEYRSFIANRPSCQVVVKHVELWAIATVAWTDDDTAIAFGRAFFNDPALLVFKRSKKQLSDAVYEWDEGTFKRVPRFADFVHRQVVVARPRDPRLPLADQLCGRRTDPPWTEAEHATARARYPDLVRAWALVSALKAAGHAVPSGPVQLLAVADALAGDRPARAILDGWKRTAMPIKVDEATVAAAIAALI